MEIPKASERVLARTSLEFLESVIAGLTESVDFQSPVVFSQENRYIPESVSPRYPGYINYDLTPYFIEILECFDVRSPVREVAIKKGVQIAYTTMLESVVFYLAGHIKTAPAMFVTADLGLSASRIENNILPMFQYSGMSDLFRSSDIDNSRKQGVTKDHLQWVGGGYLLPYGAKSAAKARQATILFMLMDELDGWQLSFIRDGDPIRLFKDRCSGVWGIRKILMGSTPLLSGSSHIEKQFNRGDRRIYKCRCLKCGQPQHLRWGPPPSYHGQRWGIVWEMMPSGELDIDSVRYVCKNCFHGHQENDKPKFINKDNSFWEPTSTPVEPNIRSYHVPALLSPVGMQPWYKCVSVFLDAFDPETKLVKDHSAMQVFYNNILGEPYDISTGKIHLRMASAHRRTWYVKGEIKNKIVKQYCESGIQLLTCTVDAHKKNLAVAVWGWAKSGSAYSCWLIEYFRINDDSESGCEIIESKAWTTLRELIEEKVWISDDNLKYKIAVTFVDSGWSAATVCNFCEPYEFGVYPIIGRDTPGKMQTIKEFSEFTTQIGTTGYKITVNYYKDRIAPSIRRMWTPDNGVQKEYTFNAPMDTTDDEITELTREYKKEKKLPNGQTVYEWHRPGNAPQELWDLMVYGHASIEVLAWMLSRDLELENVDWRVFWEHCDSGAFYKRA